MPARRDLPLEKKIKILTKDMPLSKEVRDEYLKRGVYTLKDMVRKFHKKTGVVCLPFITEKAFNEGGYFVVKMGFEATNDGIGFVSDGLREDYILTNVKKRINTYINEKV